MVTSPRFTCPCCGHRTLDEGPAAYELCPVCHWEDEGRHDDDELTRQGPNGMTLAEGQRRYRRYGSAALHIREQARPPRADEPLDPTWEAQPAPSPDEERRQLLPDFGVLLSTATERAVALARAGRDERAIGRLEGLREAIELLATLADSFEVPREHVGLDPALDLQHDLLLDPPDNRFAG